MNPLLLSGSSQTLDVIHMVTIPTTIHRPFQKDRQFQFVYVKRSSFLEPLIVICCRSNLCQVDSEELRREQDLGVLAAQDENGHRHVGSLLHPRQSQTLSKL